MSTVLIIVSPGAEEIETITVADVLVRVGCKVTLASTFGDTVVPGSRELPLATHTPLDAIGERSFDCLYLPGGMGSATTARDDARIQDLLAAQAASDRLLAVMCAAPMALLPRGLASGRRLTCYPDPDLRTAIAREATWIDEPVVIDGNLVTSQGPGTALCMALTLAGLLVDANKAQAVARAMIADRDG